MLGPRTAPLAALRRVSTFDVDAMECGTYDECTRQTPRERAIEDAVAASLAIAERAAARSAAACSAALAFSEEQRRWLLGESALPM